MELKEFFFDAAGRVGISLNYWYVWVGDAAAASL